MSRERKLRDLAGLVKELFRKRLKEFRPDDFVKVADLLGFDAYEKHDSVERLKPVAENYLPEIIGTNLQYAVESYVWETHVPMTDNGITVSGFFDKSQGNLPDGYVMDEKRRVLIKLNVGC